jgi:hypothetical protein
MKRFTLGACLALGLGVLVGACGDDSAGGGGGGYVGPDCSQYATCGSCTPVLGCGWCQVGAAGFCASDPGTCGGGAWQWDAGPGCGSDLPAKPGVNPASDAGGGNDATTGGEGGSEGGGSDATSDTASGGDAAPDAPATSDAGDGSPAGDDAASDAAAD